MRGRLYDEGVPPEALTAPGMAEAIAARDIATVYRILQRFGMSQRRIAALAGQSEISEILSGRRVETARVLERICDGLGIPRAQMGLAGVPTTSAPRPPGASAPPRVVTMTRPPQPLPSPANSSEQAAETGSDDPGVLSQVLQLGLRVAMLHYGLLLSPGLVLVWTGGRVRALRDAHRHSRRGWAARLGVSERTVTNWESGRGASRHGQRALDAALRRAPVEVLERFYSVLAIRPELVEPDTFGNIIDINK